MSRIPHALALALPLALVALAVPALAANPEPPVVSTGSIGSVTQTGASFTATVNPGGAATSYRFEYGTSDSYGLTTAERDAGSGSEPVQVSVPVSGLTSDTTYHVRVVATNAAGIARGSDRTFTTAAPPRAPGVSTGSARSVRADAALLTGSLDARGAETSYRFEWGTTTRYGRSTPATTASWSGSRSVSAQLTGLAAYTTYYYRLVATNPTGTTRGSRRSLRTLRAPTSITLGAGPNPVDWGSAVTISGQVLGSGVGGTSLAVQRSDFPFARAPWVPKTFSADRSGRFSTSVGPLWETTRLQLVTRSTNVAASPVVTVAVRVRVGVRRTRTGRRAIELAGAIRPAVPQARVSVQRRTLAGAWVPVARGGVSTLPGNRSRYRLRVPRARRTSEIRVVVQPMDGGAHATGTSRTLLLRGRAAAR